MEKEKLRLLSFLSNPIFGTLSFIIALFSLALMVHFYSVGKLKKDLKFYSHPIKIEIAKSGYSAPLEIFYNNEKVNEDITAFQIAIWNDGKLPIEESDILEGIILSTDPKTPILDASIKKVTRDVINLSLDKQHYRDGYIPISWRILEKNDGGIIQVIIAGKPTVQPSIRGIIKGQGSIEMLGLSIKVKGPDEQYISDINLIIYLRKWIWTFPFLISFIVLIVSFMAFVVRYRDIKKSIQALRYAKTYTMTMFLMMLVVAIIIYLYLSLFVQTKVPPFSF
jgi:hypothetical protein